MSMLHSRRIGRSWLAVYATERPGTGLKGATCARPTGYAVRHMANRSGEGRTLGVFDTLQEATEFVDGYKLSFGLL